MRFSTRKRRQPPAIIIISLIDILIVLLIFLMVTTTFKRQPVIKLALPESKQAKQGSSEDTLIVTVAKQPPYFYLGTRLVTLDKLQEELVASVKKMPQMTIAIRSDTLTPFGQVLKVVDVASAVGIKSKSISVYTQKPSQP
ncbi:MAG: biopolymer transporter ExbD [Pedosphaera sp.]|nr:biopolymer transporter ExbD [Pedosphaera sp.]